MSAADRHVPAELTLRDLGRAAGYPDPAPGTCPECGQREDAPLADVSLDLLALTADYAIGHPLRQAVGHYVSRLALAEGKIQTAVERLERGTGQGDEWDAADAATDALEILQR